MLRLLYRCLRGLRLEQWSGEGLDRTLERSEQRQGCHEEKYNASSFSCPPTASNFFCDDRNTEKDCGVSLSINGDFLETVFHEVVDVGRLMLQLMEDLPKLQTPAFIAVSLQRLMIIARSINGGTSCVARNEHKYINILTLFTYIVFERFPGMHTEQCAPSSSLGTPLRGTN